MKVQTIKKYQGPIVWSYGYKLKYVEEQYRKPCKYYCGEDAINKFARDITSQSK